MKVTILATAGLALLAGCGMSTAKGAGTGASGQAAASSPMATPASSAPAQPLEAATKAGVKAAASTFYDLYSAAQYGAAFQFVDPAQQKTIGKATYLAMFKGCPSPSEGLARVIKKVTLAGNTAVVTETIAGIASNLGSATDSFIYTGGRWYFHYPPQVMSLYAQGSVAADVAAARTAGYCASS